MPALINAHDHARPLSPTSFGGAGKPLETWLLRLGAMPAIDPYLGRRRGVRSRRAGRRGLGDGPLRAPARPDAADRGGPRGRARRRGRRRAGHLRAVHARPQSAGLWAARLRARRACRPRRAARRGAIPRRDAEPGRTGRPRRGDRRRRSRVRPSPSSSAPTARNGARTNCCGRPPRPPREPAAASICICSRRCYQRAFADAAYPQGRRCDISTKSAC